MKQKWLVKIATPLLALTLMSACGTTNNNDVPQEENDNIPEDTNAPGGDTPNDNKKQDDIDDINNQHGVNNQGSDIDPKDEDGNIPNNNENENLNDIGVPNQKPAQ